MTPEVPVTVTAAVPTACGGRGGEGRHAGSGGRGGIERNRHSGREARRGQSGLTSEAVLGVTVMVLVALAPCTTLSVGVEVETEKDAGGTTVKAMATVALRLPGFAGYRHSGRTGGRARAGNNSRCSTWSCWRD